MITEYFGPKAFLTFTNTIQPNKHISRDDVNCYLSFFCEDFMNIRIDGLPFKSEILSLFARPDHPKPIDRFMVPSEGRPSLTKATVQQIHEELRQDIRILEKLEETIHTLRKSRMDDLSAENLKKSIDRSFYTLPVQIIHQWNLATEYNLGNEVKVMLLLLASLFQKYYDEHYKNKSSISKIVNNYLLFKIEECSKYKQTHTGALSIPQPFSSLKRYTNLIQEHYGREKQLEKVYKILQNNNLCIITGKPGFGKSSLAVKYSYVAMQKRIYDDIIFLACENTDSLKKSTGLTDVKNTDIEEALDNFLDLHMKNTKGKLLFVFDNLGKDRYQIDADQASQSPDYLRDLLVRLIKQKLSQQINNHFLITSIHDDLFYEKLYRECPLAITEFIPQEARDYLTSELSFSYTETEIDTILSTFTHIPIVLKSVKTLAQRNRSFKSLCPDYVHKNDELYYLLKSMLELADPLYSSALRYITFCYKDDIPAAFIAACVKKSGSVLELSQSITEEIRKSNESYHILDIYEENGQYFYSIHQTFQIALRRIWRPFSSETAASIFSSYSETLNFYSYYGIRDYQSVRLLKSHIESLWELLDTPTRYEYRELWIHYRWIDEYFLSSGNAYVISPFEDDREYSLRFECDRLSNCLEDGDFSHEDLADFASYLSSAESMAAVTDNLLIRSRISIFFMELITVHETACMGNHFSGLTLKDFVLETVRQLDERIQTEQDKQLTVFFVEHACMLRSMLSIDERTKRTTYSHHKAVTLNDHVLKLLRLYSAGKHPKLPASYNPDFLYHFALNLRTVPQWETPLDFIGEEFSTVIQVLENAFDKTRECNDFYLAEKFYERAENQLGNLYDICGRLAQEYKGIDDKKCFEYIRKSEAFLSQRYEIRSKTHYLSPEFMHSYSYKRYLYYTQYGLADPAIDTLEKKLEMLKKAGSIITEWGQFADKLPATSQAIYYRMKGIFFRKLLDMDCDASDIERIQYLHVAEKCFESAIQKVPDDDSVYIINKIEHAFALKSFGKLHEAKKLLESIRDLVEDTNAWRNHFNRAVSYTDQAIAKTDI